MGVGGPCGWSPGRQRSGRPTCSSSTRRREGWDRSSRRSDQCADLLAEDHALDVARNEQVEHEDRNVIVHAERDGGIVHHLDAPVEHLEVVEVVELEGIGIELGVGCVHAVDLGRLENHVGLDLDSAQRRGGVGGEVRVAGAGGQDHDPALLEVADSASPDVRLSDLRHLDGGHGARGNPDPLERILQRQRVDHRRQHAHVVAGGAIDAKLAGSHATKDVAAADDERDLDAHLVDALHLAGDGLDDREVNAVVPRAAECLAAQLEQHAVVLRRTVPHLAHSQCAQASLTLNLENLRTTMFSCSLEMFSAISSWTVVFGSRQCGCSSKQFSLMKLSTWPSTIFGMTCSGFPSCWAFASKTALSATSTSSGTSSRETHRGLVAAIWRASSFANLRKSSPLATKSVSQSTSTSTPTWGGKSLPSLCRYASTTP